jgi:hypothetical protein
LWQVLRDGVEHPTASNCNHAIKFISLMIIVQDNDLFAANDHIERNEAFKCDAIMRSLLIRSASPSHAVSMRE